MVEDCGYEMMRVRSKGKEPGRSSRTAKVGCG